MPPWLLKAAAQGAASLLPGAERVSQLAKRYVAAPHWLDEATALTKSRRVVRHLANREAVVGNQRPLESLSVLELGTGWFPVAPVALAVAGAGRVVTVDNASHVRPQHVHETVRCVVELASRGCIPAEPARLESARAALRYARPETLLDRLGVEVIVGDARTLALEAGSIDLFFSNNTLEHIPGPVIHDIFRELGRVAAREAVMSHWIDMGDHYANFDPSIGVFHFLRYPAPVWRFLNNALHYQNRLRVSDFRELHACTGWTILCEDTVSGTPEELHRQRLAPEFRSYREQDLLVYEAWMVSRETSSRVPTGTPSS